MSDFNTLGLSPETLQAVADTGYTTPTPIQEQAIPVALAGRDVLGIAQTGTGKTAAFTLPMIDRLAQGRSKARMPRSLVIAPTRELADQVAESFAKYAKYQKLSWALLIGGVSFEDQIKKLDRGVDVLIATPGRLLDHFERGRLLLTGVQMMVVDEADRMLDMGFIPDLERIFKLTPANKQTLFFSATMPPEITRLTTQFLKEPTRIEVSRPASTGENIRQVVVRIPLSDPKAKRLALRALVERTSPDSGIVFCNRKTEVDIVAKSLKVHGFDAAPIHGDLEQSQRMKTLEAFRKGELKLLVASDVAARGLDIPAVSHVFNYDVPHHADDYVHRIGRTGRAGRSGEALMIVTPADDRGFDKVLKLIRTTPDEETLDLDWTEVKEASARDNARRRERPGGRGDGARGEGGRGGDRGPRSGGAGRDRRPRPIKDHGERAEMTPVEAPAPSTAAFEPVADERPRRDARPVRDERPAREPRSPRPEPRREQPPLVETAPENRPQREAAPQREDRPLRAMTSRADSSRPEASRHEPRRDEGRGRRERDDLGPSVVGFGHDLPAFLQTRFTVPAANSATGEGTGERPKRVRKPAAATSVGGAAPKARRVRKKVEAAVEV
jgi:superfamily II DNA/RNA helicase